MHASLAWDPVLRCSTRVLRFEPRFVRESDLAELSNLWHLSRTACAGARNGRWERMNWAATQFAKNHTYVSATGAYKDLDAMLEFGGR
jgi:hypothetical protein